MNGEVTWLKWLTLPFQAMISSERQERKDREQRYKEYVEARTRLMPAFTALMLNQLARFVGLTVPDRDKEHAASLVDDVKKMVDRITLYEGRNAQQLGRGIPTSEFYAERNEHLADIPEAVQRRIEYCVARVHDDEFLHQFSEIYALLKRYRQAHGSNEFIAEVVQSKARERLTV